MNVTCSHCKTKLNIPDHKLPQDRDTSIKCPKCMEIIRVPALKRSEPTVEKNFSPSRLSFEDRLNALVCIDHGQMAHTVKGIVQGMGMAVETVSSANIALNKMEYHIYHLMIIDDAFDRENAGVSGIIERLNTIDMSLRRRICLILISKKIHTADNMAALHASVNCILHKDDLDHLEGFLSSALADHKNLYTVYNETLKRAGKA